MINIWKNTIFWSIIISLIVGGAFALSFSLGLLDKWEMVTYDWRFMARGAREAREDIIICTIDDDTLKKLETTYPIPRDFYVPVLETLKPARGVGLDILFVDSSPLKLQQIKDAHKLINILDELFKDNTPDGFVNKVKQSAMNPYLLVAEYVKKSGLAVLKEDGTKQTFPVQLTRDGKTVTENRVLTFYIWLRSLVTSRLHEEGKITDRLKEDDRLQESTAYLAKRMDEILFDLDGFVGALFQQHPGGFSDMKKGFIQQQIRDISTNLSKTPDTQLINAGKKLRNIYFPMFMPNTYKGKTQYLEAIRKSEALAEKVVQVMDTKKLWDMWHSEIAMAKDLIAKELDLEPNDLDRLVELAVDARELNRTKEMIYKIYFTDKALNVDRLPDVKNKTLKDNVKRAFAYLSQNNTTLDWLYEPDTFRAEIAVSLKVSAESLDSEFSGYLARLVMVDLILANLKDERTKWLDLWHKRSAKDKKFSPAVRKRLSVSNADFEKLGGDEGLRTALAEDFKKSIEAARGIWPESLLKDKYDGNITPDRISVADLTAYKLAQLMFGEDFRRFLPLFINKQVDGFVIDDATVVENFLFSNDYDWRMLEVNYFSEQTVDFARKLMWSLQASEQLFTGYERLAADRKKTEMFFDYVGSQLKIAKTNLNREWMLDFILRKKFVSPMGRDYKDEYSGMLTSVDITPPLLALNEVGRRISFVQIDPDDDGTVRSYPLVIRNGDKVFPSLALRMVMDYLHVEYDDIEIVLGKYIKLFNCKYPDKYGEAPADIVIPIDHYGKMKINWQGGWGQSFRYVSFIDAHYRDADGRQSEEGAHISSLVNGKLVVMGLTATGTTDFNPMPYQARYPMVGSHANVINTILSRSFIHTVPRWIEYLFIIILPVLSGLAVSVVGKLSQMKGGLLMGFAYLVTASFGLLFTQNLSDGFRYFIYAMMVVLPAVVGVLSYRMARIREPLSALAIAAIYALVATYLFTQQQIYWINIVYCTGGVMMAFAFVVFYKYLTEERKQRQIRHVFQHYLNTSVINEIMQNPEAIQLGGAEIEATAFFSDVVKFSTLSEGLKPNELVEVLNEYLTEMTDIIMNHDALLDKYIGDAIVAAFGVPKYQKDHAIRACFAALENREQLVRLNDKLRPMLEEKGKNELDCRIGLNSGIMTAGNMGSRSRLSYTIMGDAVNLASRFEGGNKFFGTKIMIGESTYELAKDHIEARLLDKIQVVGKTEPVKVYELLTKKGKLDKLMTQVRALYEEALHLHWSRRWDEAIDKLEELQLIRPEDGPTKELLKICAGYISLPPADDWDGRRVLTAKG